MSCWGLLSLTAALPHTRNSETQVIFLHFVVLCFNFFCLSNCNWLQPPRLVKLHTWYNSAGETMANQPTSTSMTLCRGFLTFIQYPACRMPWDNWLFDDSPTVDNEHTIPSLAVLCCYIVLRCVTCVMLCYTARSLLLCSLLLLFVLLEVDLKSQRVPQVSLQACRATCYSCVRWHDGFSLNHAMWREHPDGSCKHTCNYKKTNWIVVFWTMVWYNCCIIVNVLYRVFDLH